MRDEYNGSSDGPNLNVLLVAVHQEPVVQPAQVQQQVRGSVPVQVHGALSAQHCSTINQSYVLNIYFKRNF